MPCDEAGPEVAGLWVILAICAAVTVIAALGRPAVRPSETSAPGRGPAFVQGQDGTGGEFVVALPPGFMSMLDGRSFSPSTGGRTRATWMDGRRLIALGVLVPINEASEPDLAAMPGVSRRTAAAIVAARASHGPFASWDDVDAVKGVGAKTLAVLRRLGRL